MTCEGSKCVFDNDDGFFKPGLNPWIGYPTKLDISPEVERAHVSCFSYDSSSKLRLKLSEDYLEYDYGNDADSQTSIEFSPVEVYTKGTILEAKFVIEDATNYTDHTFYCTDENWSKTSPNQFKLMSSIHHFSEWSSWSSCHNVGKDMVTRNRTISNRANPMVQSRYCRCSDLAVLPSPRYVSTCNKYIELFWLCSNSSSNVSKNIFRILLLGGTGVGKSSFGNQIVGGQNVFEVGHTMNSKTTKMEWTSQHFLGDGQCVTVIDTPGLFDTDGNDYEQSLKMQEQLRKKFPYIDVFVLVLKGSSTRSCIQLMTE